ncbi:putative RiPP precursor [Streptomyces sp. NRRL B-1347]|nr:putative RiPP precursor [Streptomyces sp. NRRL B-1347]
MDHKHTTDTPEEFDVPPVIILGNAATLTRGGENSGVEAKQTPYD